MRKASPLNCNKNEADISGVLKAGTKPTSEYTSKNLTSTYRVAELRIFVNKKVRQQPEFFTYSYTHKDLTYSYSGETVFYVPWKIALPRSPILLPELLPPA